MMHGLLLRLALVGGEGALVVLFFASVTSFAIICERLWYIGRRHIKLDEFVRQLVGHLRAGDVRNACTVAQRSDSSVCVTALAGLMHVDQGPDAVRGALAAAVAREKLRLENKLAVLSVVARMALLVGVTGTLFDLLTLSVPEVVGPAIGAAVKQPVLSQVVATLVPFAAGLCVSLPAYLAAGLLGAYVQRRLLECDFISELIQWQLSDVVVHAGKSSRSTAQAA